MNNQTLIVPGAAILVTGGAGYIGAHTCKALHKAGYVPVVYDDLSAGHREAVRWGEMVDGDIRDGHALRAAMSHYRVSAVIHFAGLIEVGRSTVRPDLFYDINVNGLARVLEAMRDEGVGRIVFSSSAAVYGQQSADLSQQDLDEDAEKRPVSPYGDTKLAGERMMAAFALAFGYSGVALRYFNAAGADASGVIGEAHEPETHLIPLAIKAALGSGRPLTVFGADFPTPDGTCLRDYVHVTDLATAHVAALSFELEPGAFEALNLGYGEARSVWEIIRAVEAEIGPVPHSVGFRRAGDPAKLVASPARALQALNWKPQHSSIEEIVRTAAAWHRCPAYPRAPILLKPQR